LPAEDVDDAADLLLGVRGVPLHDLDEDTEIRESPGRGISQPLDHLASTSVRTFEIVFCDGKTE
jgi:hypothetical protein